MPLGSLVAQLGVDLTEYQRQLDDAYRRTNAWAKKVEALQTRLSAPGVGGTGGASSVDANFRRIEAARQSAEAEQRRMVAAQDAAFRENARRLEEASRRAQDQARQFYHQQAGAQVGFGGIAAGGPGGFLTPASLRGLGEAEQAWLKQQQAIVKAGSLVEQFGLKVGDLGVKGFGHLTEHVKRFGSTLASVVGIGAGVGVAGGLVAFGKAAIDINKQYEVSRIALAEVLSLTTKLKDEQGRVVSGTRAMAANYAESAALIQQVRREAIRTTLSTAELLKNVETTLGFALAGGATPKQGVSLIAQISNLAKSLGAQGEREQGFEVRALLTGQNVSRSRIGRALGISRQDITDAKEAGTILGFLNDKLKAGKPFLDDYAKSFAGITSTLSSKSMELIRRSTEETFGRLEKRLGNLNSLFSEENLDKWSKALAETVAQAADRLEELAHSPAWAFLQRNFSFLLFDPGAATDRDVARKRSTRGAETTAVELARLRIAQRQRDLQELEGAAAGRALPELERRGLGVKMLRNVESPIDKRLIAGSRSMLERDQRTLEAAEKALSEAHIRNEIARGKSTGGRLHRESNAQTEADLKRRQDAEQERVEVQQRLAKLRDDKRAQILSDAEADKQEARETIKDKTRLAAVLVGIDRQKARALRGLERDTAEEARGLARRVLDDQAKFAKSRVAIAKEIHSAERTAAKELRDLVRERAEAERNLTRAQIDRVTSLQRLGREEQRSGLQQAGEGLFARLGISKQLKQQFTREEFGNFPDIRQASEQAELRTKQLVRELAGQLLQPGGTSGVLESLRGRGVEVFGPSFRQEAERLQLGAAGVGEQDVMATRGEEALQRARARNDSGRPIEEAQRRLQEVDRRGTEIRDDLNRTLRDASERFGNEVRQRADDLSKLGDEARKLRQSFADSHLVIRQDLAPILAQASRFTPASAQAQAERESAQVGGLVVNGLHLHLDAKGQEALRGLTDLLREQALRTAPARR